MNMKMHKIRLSSVRYDINNDCYNQYFFISLLGLTKSVDIVDVDDAAACYPDIIINFFLGVISIYCQHYYFLH